MQTAQDQILSVSQFTQNIKSVLETQIASTWIRGEVSNLRRQASGHVYFTLKDSGAQLPCVLFRGDAMRQSTQPTEGQQLLVFGDISLYEPRGAYQLIARVVLPDGMGKLQLAFQQLKEKLGAEGLFEPANKQPIPVLPKSIGVITSPTGAAIQDFISVIKRTGWRGQITVLPTLVQGTEAPSAIIKQLDIAQSRDLDLLVLTRGGGSLEDLWAFNDEALVRAIAKLSIPTISAIGHEIDFTLSDFASDLRAETPTAAAQMITAHYTQYQDSVQSITKQFKSLLTTSFKHHAQQYEHLKQRLQSYTLQSRLEYAYLKQDELLTRLKKPLDRLLPIQSERLSQLSTRLQNASVQATLNRGFALLKKPGGHYVKSVTEISQNESLTATLSDGDIQLTS